MVVDLRRCIGCMACDWANTKYIINFGSNVLETAYFMNPNAQRLVDGVVGNKAKLVTFDVRLSNTAEFSDEWYTWINAKAHIYATC